MANIDALTNSHFKVLSYLYDIKDRDNLVRITQAEVSKELNLSKPTMNNIFKVLKENDYIVHDDTRVGCYYITDEGIRIIRLFRRLSK